MSEYTEKRLKNIHSCMRQRCYNPKHTAAPWYHDRGIKVCEEWMNFQEFKTWAIQHGYADDLTIDRIDPDGDYCPSNCRWITRSENCSRARRAANGKGPVHGPRSPRWLVAALFPGSGIAFELSRHGYYREAIQACEHQRNRFGNRIIVTRMKITEFDEFCKSRGYTIMPYFGKLISG